jgi:hypothetical protein
MNAKIRRKQLCPNKNAIYRTCEVYPLHLYVILYLFRDYFEQLISEGKTSIKTQGKLRQENVP